MYSLFVSSSADSWNGGPFLLELSRCVREYTTDKLTDRYGELMPPEVDELRRLPCIFAYENGCGKNPKFGVVRDIIKRQGQALIEYDILPLDPFLTLEDLREDRALLFLLDIREWEMNRTHWAVKDIDLARELRRKGISLPPWVCSTAKAADITTHQFDVALSFPGEVRKYVEQVAAELERIIGPNSYFYDDNYRSQLARPSLDILLQDIYGKRSRFIVVFVCADYQKKDWCGIEFRAIKDIIAERKHDRIMFVRMDDGEVSGVFKTDGYIDGRENSPADVARFIQERVELL